MFHLIGLKVINPNYDVNTTNLDESIVIVKQQKQPNINLQENKKKKDTDKKCC